MIQEVVTQATVAQPTHSHAAVGMWVAIAANVVQLTFALILIRARGGWGYVATMPMTNIRSLVAIVSLPLLPPARPMTHYPPPPRQYLVSVTAQEADSGRLFIAEMLKPPVPEALKPYEPYAVGLFGKLSTIVRHAKADQEQDTNGPST